MYGEARLHTIPVFMNKEGVAFFLLKKTRRKNDYLVTSV